MFLNPGDKERRLIVFQIIGDSSDSSCRLIHPLLNYKYKIMYVGNKDNGMTISIGKKLYEEKDYPLGSKIISEDKVSGLIQRESNWRGEIKGFNLFPDGSLQGSGISFVHNNGVSISHWQGTFIPIDRVINNSISTPITFKGRDANTNNRFIVLRTFFSNDVDEFRYLDGLVCIAEGIFDLKDNCFKSTGYEWSTKSGI